MNCKQSGFKIFNSRGNISVEHTLADIQTLVCFSNVPSYCLECLSRITVVFKQGCTSQGQGELDGLMFAQHFGLDKLHTGSIVLNIKGALFDTGDQTMVK